MDDKFIRVPVKYKVTGEVGILSITLLVGNDVYTNKLALTGGEGYEDIVKLTKTVLDKEPIPYTLEVDTDSIKFYPKDEDVDLTSTFITLMFSFESKESQEYSILTDGFENSVRSLIGETEEYLSDTTINSKSIALMAEMVVKSRVKNWEEIVEENGDDYLVLEAAVIYYICYLLAPTMANRTYFKVKTIELSWEKLRTNWSDRADEFLKLFEEMLDLLGSGDLGSQKLMVIASVIKGEEAE